MRLLAQRLCPFCVVVSSDSVENLGQLELASIEERSKVHRPFDLDGGFESDSCLIEPAEQSAHTSQVVIDRSPPSGEYAHPNSGRARRDETRVQRIGMVLGVDGGTGMAEKRHNSEPFDVDG